MDAEAIAAEDNVGKLQQRHRELLGIVEDFHNGKTTELTGPAAVAEKVLIKARLRELGEPVKTGVRKSTLDSILNKQRLTMGSKGTT